MFNEFLRSHLVDRKITGKDLKLGKRIRAITGNRIHTNRKDKTLYVYATRDLPLAQQAEVLYTVETDNGVVHVIDKVLVTRNVKTNLDALSRVRIR